MGELIDKLMARWLDRLDQEADSIGDETVDDIRAKIATPVETLAKGVTVPVRYDTSGAPGAPAGATPSGTPSREFPIPGFDRGATSPASGPVAMSYQRAIDAAAAAGDHATAASIARDAA